MNMCSCDLISNPRVVCEAHQVALTELLEQSNADNLSRAADVLQQAALGLGGMCAVQVQDVPRLMVQSACRGVEKLIELYERQSRTGRLTTEEQGALKIMIRDAATDLLRALNEGVETAVNILKQIDVRREA